MAACEEHAKIRELVDDDATFWVCAYANRQHELGAGLSTDPRESSFFKAMKLAKGVLLITHYRLALFGFRK